MHGTQIHLIVAHLRYLRTSTMPVTEYLYLRRSRAFYMKLQSERAGALRLCIGLVEYMRSGKAEIGLLQKVFEVSSSQEKVDSTIMYNKQLNFTTSWQQCPALKFSNTKVWK